MAEKQTLMKSNVLKYSREDEYGVNNEEKWFIIEKYKQYMFLQLLYQLF